MPSDLQRCLDACAALRRLPQQRWLQPPMPPLGSRNPAVAPALAGASVEARARELVSVLMHREAAARGVQTFTPDVPVFALPDVLQVLLHALAETADATELASVASELRSWV